MSVLESCPQCHRSAGADARFCDHCGQRPDQTPPEPPADPTQSPPVRSPGQPPFVAPLNPGVKAYLGIGLVAVLLAAMFGGGYAIQHAWYDPQAAVSGYFEALRARDAERALSYLRLERLEDGPHLDRSLLTDRILTGDRYTPPSRLRISRVSQSEESGQRLALAALSYRIGDTPYQTSLYLRRDEQTNFGVFHRWRIIGGLSLINLGSVAGAPVRLNGVALPSRPVERPGDARSLIVFPGRYTLGVADNPLVEARPREVTAGPEGVEVQLDVRIRASAVNAVRGKVRAYLDRCVRSTEVTPPNCPFQGHVYFGTVTDVDWSIVRYPEVAVQFNYEGQVTVRSTGYGVAKLTGKWSDTGDSYSREHYFYLSGTATVVDGEVGFQPSG